MNVTFLTKNVLFRYSKFNKTVIINPLNIKQNLNFYVTRNLCQNLMLQVNLTSNHPVFTLENKCITFNNSRRWFSEEIGPPTNKLPPLMDFPKIVWPSVIKSIRNFILATFIIRPYFDRDFSLPDFVAGSKKAVEVVSHTISSGNLKALEGLVTNDVIPTLQNAVALMSLPQREQLAINMDDIYFSFPYQIGIIFNEEEEKEQKRIVEITMVYHSLRGLGDMRTKGEEPPLNMGVLPEYRSRISICNYRFVREYTKGVESDWTVNMLNHFRPIDDEVE